ncbi:MAG: hypothetical protein LBS58_04485, partial [Coriobacteriales bacterium]|nr:hypothetical protein [Coriobacteriales bacterium]
MDDMPQRNIRVSMRVRVAAIIMAVVLVIAVISTTVGVVNSQREITKTVSDDLLLVGHLASDMIVNSIEKIDQDASYVGNIMDNAYGQGGVDALGAAMDTEISTGPNFISIAYITPDGTFVSRERKEFEYARPTDDTGQYLAKVPDEGVTLDNSELTDGGTTVIRAYTRLPSGAVFIATLRGDYFSQLIAQSNYGVYNTGKVSLIDGGGYVVADTNVGRVGTHYSSPAFANDGFAQLAQIALAETVEDVTQVPTAGGDTIVAFIPIEHAKEHWALLVVVLASETPAESITRIFLITGVVLVALGILFALFLSNLITRPYTELDQRNVELSRLKVEAEGASRAKGDFLSSMSHEIRTPLNAIIGMTQVADAATDVARKDYCITKIEEASTHLLGVINDILDMSKIESGKLELAPHAFDFRHMLAKVADIFQFKVEEKHLTLGTTCADDVPSNLFADEQRLSQVVANLLSNAVKFTPDGGTICVDARLAGLGDDGVARIEVAVTDSGIGISNEQKELLFNSFQQADKSIASRFGGTGLGLAISKRIVELMNGTIRVDS